LKGETKHVLKEKNPEWGSLGTSAGEKSADPNSSWGGRPLTRVLKRGRRGVSLGGYWPGKKS